MIESNSLVLLVSSARAAGRKMHHEDPVLAIILCSAPAWQPKFSIEQLAQLESLFV